MTIPNKIAPRSARVCGALLLCALGMGQAGAASIGGTVTGPGIKDKTRIKIEGLAAGELKELKHVNREFPLGVDSIYLDRSGRLTSIPRSTRIGGH